MSAQNTTVADTNAATEAANQTAALIVQQVDLTALQPERAIKLAAKFAPLVDEMTALITEAGSVNVTSVDQVDEIKKSRELRLRLVKVRTGADKIKQTLKEDVNKLGRGIDALFNYIKSATEPAEARLREQETIAVRLEQERREKLIADRTRELTELGGDPSVYQLADMTPEQYATALTAARNAKRLAELDRRLDQQLENRLKTIQETTDLPEDTLPLSEIREWTDAVFADWIQQPQQAKAKRLADEQAERDRIEAERRAEIEAAQRQAQRTDILARETDLLIDGRIDTSTLGGMTDGEFTAVLSRGKTERAERIEREAAAKLKAEEDAKEKSDCEKLLSSRLSEIAKETDLLFDPGVDPDQLAHMSEDEYLAMLENGRQAQQIRLAAEAAAKAKADAEAAELARIKAKAEAEAEAAKRAALAPDRDKLFAFSDAVEALELPKMETGDGVNLVMRIHDQQVKFAAWIRNQATKL
jgi:hypothetical protein